MELLREIPLPKVLVEIIQNYLTPYTWYLQVHSVNKIPDMPRETLEEYFEILVQDQQKEPVLFLTHLKHPVLLNRMLLKAVHWGDLGQVVYFIALGATELNKALEEALSFGPLPIIEHLISRGATTFDNLYLAASRGDLGLVKYILSLPGPFDLNLSLNGATLGGHLEIVKHLVSLGAPPTNFGQHLYDAVLFSQEPLIEYFASLGPSVIHSALLKSQQYGNSLVVQQLTKRFSPSTELLPRAP